MSACPTYTEVGNALADTDIAIAKDYRLNANGVIEQETVYTGQMAFVTDYEYDAYGRLETKTLSSVPGENASGLEPTRVGMEYSNSTGYPTALTNGLSGSARVVYEENTDMDHFGNVVEKTLGNTTLVRSFDPATSRVASIQATANATVLVDYEYEFNIVGEIIGRNETITNRDEKFGYLDGYSRQITNVWVKGINESDSSYRAEETYVYDALGNIRQHRRNNYHNNVTFDMDYNYQGKRLTDITGTFGSSQLQEDFDYDNNGNVTSLGFYALEYNSRNLLSKVASSNRSDTTEYWYDENGTRYKRTAKIENIVTSTFMMDGYERVESGGWVEHRHYIGSNTLITTNDFGSKTRQHFIRDHIGSVVAVVDGNGSVLQRKRYTVFGEQIETFTASGLPQMLGISEKGFTNHEHIPGFQLIHMNGRLYHPRLGRFLQADIIIQDSRAPVNYSRYAYVLNNPLGYTDPSGYAWWNPSTWGDSGSDSGNNDNDHSKTSSSNDSTNTAPSRDISDDSSASNPNVGDENESLAPMLEILVNRGNDELTYAEKRRDRRHRSSSSRSSPTRKVTDIRDGCSGGQMCRQILYDNSNTYFVGDGYDDSDIRYSFGFQGGLKLGVKGLFGFHFRFRAPLIERSFLTRNQYASEGYGVGIDIGKWSFGYDKHRSVPTAPGQSRAGRVLRNVPFNGGWRWGSHGVDSSKFGEFSAGITGGASIDVTFDFADGLN